MSEKTRHPVIMTGVWAWGTIAAVMAGIIFIVVLTGWPRELYGRFRDSANVLGAIVAAGALAWSHFFKAADNQSIEDRLVEISHRLDELQIRT